MISWELTYYGTNKADLILVILLMNEKGRWKYLCLNFIILDSLDHTRYQREVNRIFFFGGIVCKFNTVSKVR